MAIRTKEECHHTSVAGSKWAEVCEDVPIVDWKLYPQNPKLAVSNNPQTFVQNIQVPELQYIYPGYDGFRFQISVMNSSPVEWAEISSPKLNNNRLDLQPGENTDLTYTFQNLGLLDLGVTQMTTKCIAFGVKNGVETELTSEVVEGVLEMSKSDNSGSTITTNKETFNLTFNLANNVLSGDKEIVVYSKKDVGTADVPFGLQISKTDNTSTTSLIMNLTQTAIVEGSYSEQMIVKADNKQKYVTIKLNVLNDATQFYVTPDYFGSTLLLSENKKKSGVVTVENPNGLTITLESFPSFMNSCVFTNGKVTFETKSASQLGVGLFSGNIILKAGNVEKSIFVKVDVVEHIVNDFSLSGYFFALDRNKVQMTRVNPLAVKVYMKLDMFFMGYDQMFNESQTYQLPYFKNKVTFYPGDEVNDFFAKKRTVQDFTKSFDAYQFAVVKMTFSEIDEADNVVNSFVLDNVRFAPGYQPKCFPFFTDFPMRKFYNQSRLSISTDLLNSTPDTQKLLSLVGENERLGYVVRSYLFNSTKFNSDHEVMDLGQVKYLPVPTPQKVVNIFFETHNLTFDWFSCAGDYELPKDFEHTVSENVATGTEEKFETKQNDTLSINTGWILNEEIDLIDAIFNSNFVMIQLPEKTVRAIPTSKKNALKSSEEGFKSMLLEFKILKDER